MDTLITAADLAERLRLRPTTIRRWTRERLIPAIRITGKVTRYDYDEVCAALRSRDRSAQRSEAKRGNR